MGPGYRQFSFAVLCAAAIAAACGPARASCEGQAGELGDPGSQDLIQIGHGGALAAGGMRGCGLHLETRFGARKLSFISADLVRAWNIAAPVDDGGERMRFTQAGIDLWRDPGLRWTVRVSAAENLPEQGDLERLSGGDDADRQLGARGMAMTSILRTRDGRAEWLSEMAGADNGVAQWGMASRQRLRAILLRGGGFRLDGIVRHERTEPAFNGPVTALQRDRDTQAGGLTARLGAWTAALEHYRSRDNLEQRQDVTNEWVGWTGTVRYRLGADRWWPREVAVVLNRTDRTETTLAAGDERASQQDRMELKLAWPGPTILRLEGVGHSQLGDGRVTGQAGEVAVGLERGRNAGDWRWLAAGRVGQLVGDEGYDRESETRLTLRLGAEARTGIDLRLGLQGEFAAITPRGGQSTTETTLQLRANLRF